MIFFTVTLRPFMKYHSPPPCFPSRNITKNAEMRDVIIEQSPMNDFNFTNFQLLLLSQGGFKPLLSGEYLADKFHQYNHNCLKNFSFTHFLLIKGYGKYSLRKESLIAPFVEWFKTQRERVVLTNFMSTYRNLLKPFSFPDFLMIENREQIALRKDPVILLFSQSNLKHTLTKSN